MDKVTEQVARQYTEHAYPHPYDDLAAEVAAGKIDLGDPSVYGPMFWPEGEPRHDLDILVAGCGTVQAAMLAFKNPKARVAGIELSEASLAHERFLREKHGLANLELYQGDLREAGKLGRRFDLIVSSGVLHHLADPGEGLRALRDVLAPKGAMMLMVYGAMGRSGVYPMQDAFRRMGLGQSAGDVATVRRVLAELSPIHVLQPFLTRNAAPLEHDTELVDVFLHPQDVAYSVPQLLAWLDDNDLAFQGWAENHLYYPDALIPPATAERLRRLPEPDQWAVVETLHGQAKTHSFVVRHRETAVPVDFASPDWLDLRPTPQPGAATETPADGVTRLMLWDLAFPLAAPQLSALRLIDGERRIADILAHPAFQPPPGDVQAFGKAFFSWLWRIGAVMVRR